ncbi:hypothetical protein [Methanobrevibacter sp. YE315]|nr:hypothetical protein [Methanobrevibacter sp. YE315]
MPSKKLLIIILIYYLDADKKSNPVNLFSIVVFHCFCRQCSDGSRSVNCQ